MSDKYYDIEKSFLDSLPSGYEYQYPGVLLDGKPDLWVGVNNIFGDKLPLSIGPRGIDLLVGLFQIDIYDLGNSGMGRILEVIDKFSQIYHISKHIGKAVIISHSVGGNRQEGKYRILTLSINYEIQTQRGF